MDFDALPLEIKFHILSFLTEDELRCKFATTCKEWLLLSKQPHLKTSLSFTNKNQLEIIELLNKYYRLRELKFTDINSWYWIYKIPTMMSLRKLTVYLDKCTSTNTLLHLIARLPNIEELRVDVVLAPWHACTTQIPACKLLKKLDFQIYHDNQFSQRKSCTCGDIFIENCPKIREIDVNGTTPNKNETLLKIIKFLSTSLRKLVIDVRGLTADTSKSLQLLNKFSQLTDLRIEYANYFPNSGLMNIKQLTNLQRLEIIDCDNDFIKFFKDASLPHLTILLIYSFNLQDQTLQLIATNYPGLREVGFGDSIHISDNGINAIIDNCCLMEKLNLFGLCSVTGTSFVDIETRLPNLIELNFLSCFKVKRTYCKQIKQKKPSIRVCGPSVSEVTCNEHEIFYQPREL